MGATSYDAKIVVITGAGSGIGRALAEKYGRLGATVVVTDINELNAKTVADGIVAAGGRAEASPLDVGDVDGVRKLIEDVADRHGRIDYLYNNAGIGLVGEAKDTTLADWRRVVDINLMGVVNGVLAAYPVMIRQGSGHIVNTASINGLAPFPLSIGYNATKYAVVGLTTSLRTEAARYGIQVSVVCPGFIDTPMKDVNRYLNIDKGRALKELPFRLHSVEKCAREILKGVDRNKPIVVVTPEAKVLWLFYRILPRLFIFIGTMAAKRSCILRLE